MGKKEKAPCLRFKDTNGKDYPAWEQRKLEELASKFTGGGTPNTSNPNYWNGEIPWIQSSDLKEDDVLSLTVKKHISQEGLKNSATKIVPKNSLVIVTRVGVGKLVVNTQEIATSQDFLSLSGIKGDSRFLAYSLYSLLKKITRRVQGTSIKGITKTDFLKETILVPALEEQEKISSCMVEVDKLITLHQRKLETLKKLKRTLLQKMFPKKGQLKPELRFPGFTNDWEQRKFEDLFTEYAEKGFNQYPALSIVQGAGTIERDKSNRNLSYSTKNLGNYKIVYKDDFILHLRSFEGGLERACSTGLVSPAYHVFHSDGVNSSFFYCIFRSSNFINRLLKPCVYGIRDGKSINISELKNIYLNVPGISEQKKIGDFFDSIDSLITLHQRKLETYKKLKKSLLQKMFI